MTDSATSAATSRTMTRQESSLIWLLLAAAFVAILNETTMSVAIPHLVHDFGITPVAAQWLTTAFMLTMAVVIPTTGFLLQRLTTRAVFILASSLFTLGTAIAFASVSFEMLLVARVVQAAGTAIMMPLLMTTVMMLVPAESRGRFMGRIGIVMSLAPAIGPTLAGALLDTVGWRWIFGVVLPIAIVSLLAGLKWMPRGGETSQAPLDVFSVILSAFGFGGLVYGVTQISAVLAPQAPQSALITMVVSLSVGLVALAAFIARQLMLQRKDDALLDLRVFLSRNFTMSIIQMFVLSIAFFGALTILPLYLQNVVGLTATESGLVVLPGSIAMGVLGPFIGRIYDARGPRILLIPGAIVVAAVLWFYAATLTPTTPVWIIVVAQTCLSIGLALSFTPLFTASLGSVVPKLYSHGSAVLSTIQQVAGAAGIAVLVTVMTLVSTQSAAGGTSIADAGAQGSRAAFLIAASFSLITIVLSFFIKKPENIPVAESDSNDRVLAGH